MAMPKATTLQQKLGFVDEDLKKPDHDKIMIWLDNQVEKSVKELIGLANNWKGIYIDDEWCDLDIDLPGLPERPNPKVLTKQWEYPCNALVKNRHRFMEKGNYTIGFIDMYVACEMPILHYYSIKSRFNDADSYRICTTKADLLFEVKTIIPSLGELLRQINLYKLHPQNDRWSQWYIVSPDDKFKPQIEAQDIKFIKYQG